jgi:hypothetical protein
LRQKKKYHQFDNIGDANMDYVAAQLRYRGEHFRPPSARSPARSQDAHLVTRQKASGIQFECSALSRVRDERNPTKDKMDQLLKISQADVERKVG